MPGYLICASDDLKADARLYAEGNGLSVVKTLNKVRDGAVLVLYTHGQYYIASDGKTPKANNRILWDGDAIDASAAYGRLQEVGLEPVDNLTLVVHACFTAGTVERPPKAAKSLFTFAGQLCSAMKADFSGLRVVGFQGMSKSGKAGYAVNAQPVRRRFMRGEQDPNTGARWQVVYNVGGTGDVEIEGAGEAVTWR